MLFWPGIPGRVYGDAPHHADIRSFSSLIVALIYLPVMGGVSGRMSRNFNRSSNWLSARTPWLLRAALVPPSLYMIFLGAMQMLNSGYLLPGGALAGALMVPARGLLRALSH